MQRLLARRPDVRAVRGHGAGRYGCWRPKQDEGVEKFYPGTPEPFMNYQWKYGEVERGPVVERGRKLCG